MPPSSSGSWRSTAGTGPGYFEIILSLISASFPWAFKSAARHHALLPALRGQKMRVQRELVCVSPDILVS